jgi:hypothetical protein
MLEMYHDNSGLGCEPHWMLSGVDGHPMPCLTRWLGLLENLFTPLG